MNIQAAVVREKSGPFVLEDIALDEPRADEVIVRVVSAGICHTDLIPGNRRSRRRFRRSTVTRAPESWKGLARRSPS